MAACAEAPDAVVSLGWQLLQLAPRGLSSSHIDGTFAHTAQPDPDRSNGNVTLLGTNVRYAAIAALGVARLSVEHQRVVLGRTASELASSLKPRIERDEDPGATALALWAAAELGGEPDSGIIERVTRRSISDGTLPTVDAAWSLAALLACGDAADAGSVKRTADRLKATQHDSGLFPHLIPETRANVLRRHVGCFADQVYPIQALARHFAATGDRESLERANLCATAITSLQGSAGQWWWHYDVRTGRVVEGYPVYSVHQHAMAPMALLDLWERGGTDHRTAVARGLLWIAEHPEVDVDLIDREAGLVWRSARRHEPVRITRYAQAVASAVLPQHGLGRLGSVFPPSEVDYECRPYELGWLLYAWLDPATAAEEAAETP